MSSKFKVQSSKLEIRDERKRAWEKISSLKFHPSSLASGFTLLELIITLTVLAILVMGTLPLAQNATKRQKELRLRENLRAMRAAIDEFHRDTLGACPQGAVTTGNPTLQGQNTNVPVDPRSRVVIDDCTIFDNENLDRYPPTLDTLIEGVKVKARGMSVQLQSGTAFNDKNATDLNEVEDLLKVYLREIPVDPMTGEKDWEFRSSYQDGDSEGWDEINVFDVHSSSDAEAMNGEKYSDW
jgi:general secretion pathway protein G